MWGLRAHSSPKEAYRGRLLEFAQDKGSAVRPSRLKLEEFHTKSQEQLLRLATPQWMLHTEQQDFLARFECCSQLGNLEQITKHL